MQAVISAVVAFAVMVFFIVRPARLKLAGREFSLDYAAGSLLGVMIILALGLLSPGQALSALWGRPDFSPVTIIVLFMSLAYIAISLDSTGFFEYVSLK